MYHSCVILLCSGQDLIKGLEMHHVTVIAMKLHIYKKQNLLNLCVSVL